MNMISTGAFLNEMDASNKQPTVAEKFAAVWEKKNAKAARAGGVSLMALSLAACGSSSTTTTSSTSTTTSTTTTTVTPSSEALTIGADTVTGTSAGDSFSALRTDSISTWNSNDTISGGDGTDTLTAHISASVTPASGAVTGVENIVITSIGNTTVTFTTATGAARISGHETVTNMASTGQLTLSNLAALPTVAINNTAQTTVISTNADALDGTADAFNLQLNGATGTVTMQEAGAGNTGRIETLNITTSGAASTLDASTMDVDIATVTVTGSGAIDFSVDVFDDIATFNGSDATGAITVAFDADTVTGATNTKTITTGSGADSIDIDQIDPATVGAVSVNAGAGNDTVILGARGATDFTIVGGDGTDTLQVAATATAALFGGASGFERLTNTSATAVQNMTLYTGNSTFTILRANDDTDFTNASGIATLELNGTAAADNVLLDLAVDGSADAVTVKGIAATNAYLELDLNDIETLTVDSNAGTVDTAGTDDGTNDTIATDMTSIVAVGDNTIDLGDVSSTALTSVDASGMFGAGSFTAYFDSNVQNITVTANTTTDTTNFTGTITVKTGLGADTITGTENNDTITGGGGNDTITGGDGNDDIDGGTGSDTYVFDATGAGNGLDTITTTWAAGGDVFDFSAFAVSMTAAGAGDVAFAEIAVAATTDYDITGHLVLLSGTDATALDEASEIAALIDSAGNALGITAGGKAIVLSGDHTGANDVARGWYIHDANSDGDVADSNEVVNVYLSDAAIDLDTIVAANVDLVA